MRSLSLEIFIVSWAGQHANAAQIAQELDGFRESLTIVFSDPDPDFEMPVRCRVLRRPDSLFWTDKFRACLDAFTGKVMLVIQGDCKCDDWLGLAGKCAEAFQDRPAIGIWAPLIRGSYFEIETTRIGQVAGTSLSMVAQTDGICLAVSAPILNRMKKARYDGNIYGWGIEWMMVASAYCRNMLVMVDESILVKHPPQRGYPSEAAKQQMDVFLQQLTIQEQVQLQLLMKLAADRRQKQHRPLGEHGKAEKPD